MTLSSSCKVHGPSSRFLLAALGVWTEAGGAALMACIELGFGTGETWSLAGVSKMRGCK